MFIGHNVRLDDSAITYKTDYGVSISFELVVLGQEMRTQESSDLSHEDSMAETINGALHLLLDYAHKQNAVHRPERSAVNNKKGATPPYALLQPVMTYLKHEQSIREFTCFLFGPDGGAPIGRRGHRLLQDA